jgi:hypothetical protein
MSDFADRIHDARALPAPIAAPHPELERWRPRLAEAEPRGNTAAAVEVVPPPDPAPTAEELDAQRRRIDDLARKIDDLNATILQEILNQPGGAQQFPRTLAALAGRAAELG